MTCKFCSKTYKTDKGFQNHKCRNRDIAGSVSDTDLWVAYDLFNFWFKYNGFSKVKAGKNYDQFLKSPYFGYFIELMKMVSDVYIADPHDLVMWLSDNQIPAKSWAYESTISRYKAVQNKRGTGMERAIRTLESMTMFCDQKEIDLGSFFAVITVPEALRWIESGRLSPWVFLNTPKADDLFSRISNRDITRLANFIDVKYWDKRFDNSEKTVKEIKELLTELGLNDE